MNLSIEEQSLLFLPTLHAKGLRFIKYDHEFLQAKVSSWSIQTSPSDAPIEEAEPEFGAQNEASLLSKTSP